MSPNLAVGMNYLYHSICLYLYLLATISLLCSASDPHQGRCEWSEWRCLNRPDGVGCVAQRSRLCCNATVGNCHLDSVVHKTLYSRAEQLAEGVICLRRDVLGGGDSGGVASSSGGSAPSVVAEHQDASMLADSSSTASFCLSRPQFDGSKFPLPGWCPWTAWSSWTLECRAGLARLPADLAGLIVQLNNDTDAFKYAGRSRGCYCPASPDPDYTCDGSRLDWRFKPLLPAVSPPETAAPPVLCQWCSWESWLPACTCPVASGDQPAPRRRRRCLCVTAGDKLLNATSLTNSTGTGLQASCGDGADLQIAISAESVCPGCSHLHASYQVSQFLNPLAIGFAVYLLVALAAFLLCRLFCGNPRHSDANSRDQLSVDDFLASPPADERLTSAV